MEKCSRWPGGTGGEGAPFMLGMKGQSIFSRWARKEKHYRRG